MCMHRVLAWSFAFFALEMAARGALTMDERFGGAELALGSVESGWSTNAAALVGENRGSIFLDVRFGKSGSAGQRTIAALRTASRLTIAFYSYGNGRMQFSFGDGTRSFRHDFAEQIEPGRTYGLGVAWDGEAVRVYCDGRAVASARQPVAFKPGTVRKLNIGPYKDGWHGMRTWPGGVFVSRVRTYDDARSPRSVAGDSGISLKGVASELPATLCVTPVPASCQPPVIDGKPNDEAWSFASSMPQLVRLGFAGKSGAMPPHEFRMLYDDNNLYLRSKTHFPGRVPYVEGLQRTEAHEPQSCGVEAWEFYLWIGDGKYRFSSTAAGGTSDRKGTDFGWNPEWTCAQTRATQIDDSVVWTSEASFPWKIFGLDGPPKAAIRMNFCRNWTLASFGAFSSLDFTGKGYGLNETLPHVMFAPAASYRLVGRNDPSSGRYEEKYELSADRKSSLAYEVHLATCDGSLAPWLAFRHVYALEGGETASDALTISTTLPGYDAIVHTLTQDGRVVMRESVPYEVDPEIVTVTPLLLAEKIRIEFKKPFSGRIALQGPGGETVADVASDGADAEIPFSRRNPAGEYVLRFIDEKGSCAAEKAFGYPGIGTWENRDWHEDWILPQFEPVSAAATDAGLVAQLYGRVYGWENSYLPALISSLGDELLAGPVELIVDGISIVPSGFEVMSNSQHHVGFAARGATADVTGWLEYDGLAFNHVTVRPSGKGDVKVRYRLRRPFAKYLHAANGSGWGAKITDFVKDGESAIGNFPVLWIGNEEKGLCFFYESRFGWTGDASRTYTIRTGGDEVSVTVDVARQAGRDKPFEFEFGVIATPVKRLPPGYPFNTFGYSWLSPMNRPGRRPLNDISLLNVDGVENGDHGSFFGDQDTPDGRKRANVLRTAIDKLEKGHGTRPIHYVNACHLSSRYPEVAAYLNDWMAKPEGAMDYNRTGHWVYRLCPATTASDYGAWRTELMFKRNPELKGVYFDFGLVKGCSNADHGCHDKIPMLAMREYYRRHVVIQVERGISDPVVAIHNTDCVQLPAATFATHLLNGEHLWPQSSANLHDNRDILDTYGIPMFACELSTLPWGLVNSAYMPFDGVGPSFEKYGINGETKEDYQFRMGKAAIGALLVHDTLPCLWRNHTGILDRLVRRLDDFGVGKPDTCFVGYWRRPAIVSGADNVCVSCWTDGYKVLAAIARIDPSHEDVDLLIDFSPILSQCKSGFHSGREVRDLMEMEDPDYGWLYEAREKAVNTGFVRRHRISLKTGLFGTHVNGFDGKTLKYHLPFHSFGLVEIR